MLIIDLFNYIFYKKEPKNEPSNKEAMSAILDQMAKQGQIPTHIHVNTDDKELMNYLNILSVPYTNYKTKSNDPILNKLKKDMGFDESGDAFFIE